jgi:hypothetical protein
VVFVSSSVSLPSLLATHLHDDLALPGGQRWGATRAPMLEDIR